MGEVFAATKDGRQVALKRLRPSASVPMFLDEARVAARLHHPNIAEIYELGEVDGVWFLAMELVRGVDLSRVGPVAAAEAVRIAAQVALGLDHAHKARNAQGRLLRVVHRDVSPHNVLVAKDGAVKLIDFGVARAVGGGKPAYQSPEQADGEDGDARSDQFSLGVVLWELLTGKRLFDADSDVEIIERVRACEVPEPPHTAGPVMRALSKDPKRRFPDCKAFAEALRYSGAP
jgi:serine/threonine protein kinase